jgi:hypothetical protein
MLIKYELSMKKISDLRIELIRNKRLIRGLQYDTTATGPQGKIKPAYIMQ